MWLVRQIACVARSQALDSLYESTRWSTCGLRRLLCLCALGSCSSDFLFWQRLLCAFILSVVRRLLRLSWLRVLQLLSELLRLWVGRLLSALVAASVLRRVLRRVAQARVGRRPRLAWRRMARARVGRRMARPSLTRSLGKDAGVWAYKPYRGHESSKLDQKCLFSIHFGLIGNLFILS